MTLTKDERRQYAVQYPLQATAARAPYLFGLAFDAPLIGVSVRWPNTFHAVGMEAVIDGTFGRGTFKAECGKTGLRLLGHDIEGRTIAALWPPAVKNLPAERCATCFAASKQKRPRTRWVQPGETKNGVT